MFGWSESSCAVLISCGVFPVGAGKTEPHWLGTPKEILGRAWEISVLSGLAVDSLGQAMMRCSQVRSSLQEAAQAAIKSSL